MTTATKFQIESPSNTLFILISRLRVAVVGAANLRRNTDQGGRPGQLQTKEPAQQNVV